MNSSNFEDKYEKISNILLNIGWAVSPFVLGGDFENIYTLSTEIENSEQGDSGKSEFFISVNTLLAKAISRPMFRSFFVQRAKELDHIKEFSHNIERAILHYFKNDYLSAVLCMLPAIEGSLLSYYGWKFGDGKKPAIEKLVKEIERCRMNVQDERLYRLYSNSIASFLRKWIFEDTSISNMTFSNLNRHYVLHGMGANSYYSLSDINRIIMFFDVYIEFLSIEQNRNYTFIPEFDNSINARSRYYYQLLDENISKNEILSRESEFMNENINYKEGEANSSNSQWAFFERLTQHPALLAELQKALRNMKSDDRQSP